MSSEKTLKEHILELCTQLEEFDKELKSSEELQARHNKIQIALEIAKESLPLSLDTGEDILQDLQGRSFPNAIHKFLSEQHRSCSVKEIAHSITARGIKSNAASLINTTRAALYALKKQNKIVQINRNTWEVRTKIVEEYKFRM